MEEFSELAGYLRNKFYFASLNFNRAFPQRQAAWNWNILKLITNIF
jgi:hypothetical protein